jgi:protein TonB
MRKDGNYINNRLFTLEEISKKAEAYHKSNENAVVSLKVEKEVPMERVTEIKEVLRNAKIQHANLSQNKAEDQVYLIVEDMPLFPGGDKALKQWISENIKYPEAAKAKKIQGKVYVSFIIDPQGKVENPKVLSGIAPDLDAEALRVVSQLPKWSPGKQKGAPVKVSYTVPVLFTLK